MTVGKKLKKRIREHMEKTGMSYMAAMNDLKKQKSPPHPTEEVNRLLPREWRASDDFESWDSEGDLP